LKKVYLIPIGYNCAYQHCNKIITVKYNNNFIIIFGGFMKKFLITLIFLTISSVSFAEQGQIKQNGFFAGTSKVLGDDKGNFTIIYDGVLGLKALEGTTFGDKSSMRCVGSIVGFAGQGYESGTCVNKFEDGGTATSQYKGVFGKMLRWKYVSGTGKYKNISGGGTATIKSMNSAQDGVVHSYNEITGNYNLN
tara:strand:- start:109 stop:687 length:579 start_codon:yes stop_codon:yes gene_type:complete